MVPFLDYQFLTTIPHAICGETILTSISIPRTRRIPCFNIRQAFESGLLSKRQPCGHCVQNLLIREAEELAVIPLYEEFVLVEETQLHRPVRDYVQLDRGQLQRSVFQRSEVPKYLRAEVIDGFILSYVTSLIFELEGFLCLCSSQLETGYMLDLNICIKLGKSKSIWTITSTSEDECELIDRW